MLENYRKAIAVAMAAGLGLVAQFIPAAALIGPEAIATASGMLSILAAYWVENRRDGANVNLIADTAAEVIAEAFLAEEIETAGNRDDSAFAGRVSTALTALATPQGSDIARKVAAGRNVVGLLTGK